MKAALQERPQIVETGWCRAGGEDETRVRALEGYVLLLIALIPPAFVLAQPAGLSGRKMSRARSVGSERYTGQVVVQCRGDNYLGPLANRSGMLRRRRHFRGR